MFYYYILNILYKNIYTFSYYFIQLVMLNGKN